MNKLVCLMIATTLFAMACTTEESAPTQGDEFGIVGGQVNDFGKATFDATGDREETPNKADAIVGKGGLPVTIDREATSVWTVKNDWEETTTAAAKAAGIAWPANSGLTWEQKFTKWIDALEETASVTNSGRKTYTLITPWGKTLPAPSLECAESAIFLRVAFAAWYNLPFYMEARDAESRIYFGHFGMRRENGKFARTPDFKTRYKDHTDKADAISRGGDWPVDASLVKKKIPGTSDDSQPMIGESARTGAYFDQVFLNKRAGHFLITTLAYFGSIHLADSRNTFNVKANKIKEGDVLVKRWQARGIGHVLLVMDVNQVGAVDGEPRFEAQLASGSMPRRQPVWESANASLGSFTHRHAGGTDFAQLGGGLKRWRIAKKVNGKWANLISRNAHGDWINSNNHEEIGQRPEQFREVLRQLTREEKRDTLIETIKTNRAHLRKYPASCAARIRREEAFNELYKVMDTDFSWSASRVDENYRTLEDYVFAELSYTDSKTCCWNSSTSNMYEIAMDLNTSLQANNNACMDIVVFMNRDDDQDGYAQFRDHATTLGRASQWVDWSADESCPQANVAEDTQVISDVTPYCQLNQTNSTAVSTTGIFASEPTSIPDNDQTGISFQMDEQKAGPIKSLLLEIKIEHTYIGDLEIELVHPTGNSVFVKTKSNDGTNDLEARYTQVEFNGLESKGNWTLHVRDVVGQDVGNVINAALTIER